VFEKTLFLITYDEHGGFYDHVEPQPVPAPDEYVDESGFAFTLSGVRVPAVAVSPLIPRGTIVADFFDHASIPATVLRRFAHDPSPLTARDAAANDVLACLPLLEAPRAALEPLGPPSAPPGLPESLRTRRLDDLQGSLVELAGAVSNAREQAGPEVERIPAFEPHPDTRHAAETSVLVPGSEAARVIDSVVLDFERESGPRDPTDVEFG
jgi:phospholipase C